MLRARSGVKVWSSGHDVGELPEGGRDPLGWDDPLRYFVRAIEECPAPVIAMIEGGVWGGACEVAFACDLIIAAPSATFAVTPARLGVPYNVSGMLTFLNACSLRIVKRWSLRRNQSPPSVPNDSVSSIIWWPSRTLSLFLMSSPVTSLKMRRSRSP